jgi:beta-phosphoglucomutase-like phosphatase (HAD superfamily)
MGESIECPNDSEQLTTRNRTLIDSTPGVLNAWATFSADYNLDDYLTMAYQTHGRRLYDTLREYCGINDEEKLKACTFCALRSSSTNCMASQKQIGLKS